MLEKLRKFSTSILAKIFLFLVAIPFVFWGMGDLFRGGNAKTIVKIGKEKVSAKQFINYINKYSNPNVKIDESYIPTGLIKTVKENKFDMNNFYNISQSFLEEGGIDHNYILKYANLQKPDGIIFSNITGMGVEYFTDQPGMQFYTGNMMDTSIKGKYGKNYGKNFGMCFEPQIYPDAINHPNFPSPIIKSGETYRSKIIMKLRNNFL